MVHLVFCERICIGQANAECNNTEGSYTCACIEGYENSTAAVGTCSDVDGCPRVWTVGGCLCAAELVSQSTERHVRCCSMDGTSCSTFSASGVLWTPFSEAGVTFPVAQSMCESDGRRLCTLEELSGGVCCGTGGNLDTKMVWTQSEEGGEQSETCIDVDECTAGTFECQVGGS